MLFSWAVGYDIFEFEQFISSFKNNGDLYAESEGFFI